MIRKIKKDSNFLKPFSALDECMRVLKANGTLIFKWNEYEIKVSEVLKIIPYKPLFEHTTGQQSKTIWMTFMKNGEETDNE